MPAGSYRGSPPVERGPQRVTPREVAPACAGVDPVTTDPKGEAHVPPVRNTPALTSRATQAR